MTEYVPVDLIVEVNKRLGGAVVDLPGIESAAHRPQSGAFGVEAFPDVWSKAAAYIHGFAATQYFADGNKRTAWIVANVFLKRNGFELPRVPDIEAETFVQAIAQKVYDTADEPDLSLTRAAEWLRSKWDDARRGAAIDPRLEYVFLVAGAETPSRATGSSSCFDAEGAGLAVLTFVAGPGAPTGFPAQASFGVLGRLHWDRDDADHDHVLEAKVVPPEGVRRVNRGTVARPYKAPPLSGHAVHRSGVMPLIFIIPVTPVFLAAGQYKVELRIDGELAAILPLKVAQVGETPDVVPDWA